MSYEDKVLKYIDDHSDDIIDFMQKLIQTVSVTGDESKIGHLIAEELQKDSLEVEKIEPAPKRVSIIALYNNTPGDTKIMVYSHYDTVPAGDLDTWKYPPFSATIAEGKIWGRGAADNKVATCAATMAFRTIQNCGIKLKGNIIFTHVADEEKGGKFGFRNILDMGLGKDVDFLFYGHGGDKNSIGIAANGSLSVIIKVKGKASHTRSLEDGINAVQKAAKLIVYLKKLAHDVNSREYHLPGTDTIMKSRFSVNKCYGYVATNIVPDSCEVIIDRRITPGEDIEEVKREICQVIKEIKSEDKELEVDMSFNQRMDVSMSPADSEIVKSFQKAAKRVLGINPKPIGGSHSSDHGYFVTKHGKPVASYGIGGEGTHMANENIAINDVILTTKVYALTMMDLLGVE
jgi:succinyl-diaminopimelate desuccinylase